MTMLGNGFAGLLRCGKSCRLRWTNYRTPDLKRRKGFLLLSRIATQLPGRTDNEIKNYWNTRIKTYNYHTNKPHSNRPTKSSTPLIMHHDHHTATESYSFKSMSKTSSSSMKLMESDTFASSSAETSTARVWKYDLFMSFRGPDTRNGIVYELYDRLQNRGIKIFMDDADLKLGDVICPTLLKAIEESRLAIVVLSPNYASSTWCLEELAKICECMEDNNRILPLFYNVDPGEVRHQQHRFGDAFTKHETSGRHRSEKVQQWRNALRKVPCYSGWDSKNYETDRQLVEDIVEFVYRKVQPTEINVGDFQELLQRMPISREDDGQQQSLRPLDVITCFRPTTWDDPHQSNTNQPLPSPPLQQCNNALTELSAAAAPPAITRANGKRIGNLKEVEEMLDEPNEIVRQEMLQSVKLEKRTFENGREGKGVTSASKSLDFFFRAIQGLPHDYAEAFNDICFFLGMDKVSWIEMQSTFGDDVMEILQKKALICKSYAVASEALAYVEVLGVIVEAAKEGAKGRKIGNLEELKEMLHEPNEIVREELLKSVKVIWFPKENDMELSAKDVDLMSPSLRTFSCWRPIIGKCQEMFKQLLHWRGLNDVPFDFKQTPRLKCLQFRPTGVVDLSKMPPSLTSLKIDLRMISKADGDEADSIHFSSDEGSSILSSLEILELANSGSPRLPKGLLCRLASLTVLLIKSMDELMKLPDEFQFLPCLTSLLVKHCRKLKEISNSIGSCTLLDSLGFRECDELESLPEQLFERLSSLKVFILKGCPKMKRIPDSLTKCTSLREVFFSRNRRIKKLPRNFECLPSLQRVSIVKCKRMGGGCMDILLKMKTLKKIKITGSTKLIERWNEVKEEKGMQKMKDIVITK